MAIKCPKCQSEILDDSRFCSKCGRPLHSSEEILISQTKTILKPMEEMRSGTMLANKYKINEVLGKGGMGIVYRAEDSKLKRNVALKFLPPELMRDNEAKERFVLEAQAAAALSHPNICTIHEIDEEEGKSFIAMEYIEGQSLREKIKRGPLGINEALDIAIQVAEGLEEAHKKEIIHRDIKSANIMVTDKGWAKIMDFGLAKIKGGSILTREGTTLGTAAYMSPEQAQGKEVDFCSDIWSLGVVLYEMLYGQLPFMGDNEASILYSIVHEEAKPLKEIKPDIPMEWQQIVNRALKKKPGSRYQSASEILRDLKQYQVRLMVPEARVINFKSFLIHIRKPQLFIPTVLIVLGLCLSVVWYFNRAAKIKWARNEAIPEIIQLISKDNIKPAYALAEEAEKYIPANPTLISLWPQISIPISIQTNPPGSEVYVKDYEKTEEGWQFLGECPIDKIRVSRRFKRWKIEKDGYETVERAGNPSSQMWKLTLSKKGSIPPEMVRIPNILITENRQGMITGGDPIGHIQLESFLIDRYEVTNIQFKEFLDSGGYQKRDYWKHMFIKEGDSLSWDEAMLRFRDLTGKPGPSTWEMGSYPDIEGDFPVRGVSWFEAAAYAEFAGKSLPSIYHWFSVAGTRRSSNITPLSNFGGDGPGSVGRYKAISSYGTYDMAGNVREWCWNESRGFRYILGGDWSDLSYLFFHPMVLSPFDRSPTNGFRCVRYLDTNGAPPAATRPVELAVRDYYKEKPVDEALFQVLKQQFSYDPAELNAEVEWTDNSSEHWREEKIAFDASYNDERVIAYLFLPKAGVPPYQTVIYFPGSGAIGISSNKNSIKEFDFIMKSGRAMMFPIYKGTYERNDGLTSTWPNMSHRYSEYLIKWVKDFKRSIDYLETRSEIDIDRLAYLGFSWGGRMGAIIPALEERLKVSVLYLGGLASGRARPEVDQINFITHINIPVLMLNGKYDSIEPLETAQEPMYRLFGTPGEKKKHVRYETDHGVPRNSGIRETLEWLDLFLEPVKIRNENEK